MMRASADVCKAKPASLSRALDLTADQEKTARQMLIQGATFEDVVLTLHARGQRVSQLAVENYFRANPQLHALRAKHTVVVARKVREETQDGDPEDVEFADAVIMTGLQRLRRATADLDVNDALRRQYERENARLRGQNLRLKGLDSLSKRKLYRAQIRVLTIKWQTAREDLKALKDQVEKAKQGELSGPELAARIQEIYGLIEAPPAAPIGAPETED